MKLLYALTAALALSLQSLLAGGACCPGEKKDEPETAKTDSAKTEECGDAAAETTVQAPSDTQKTAKAE